MRDLVQKGYDVYSKNYTSDRDQFKNQKYLDDLINKLRKGSSILDLGCGSGIPVDKYLLEHGFKVTGIDISTEQIKLAKEHLPSGDFFQKDMSQVDFAENTFDAIVSFYAIFHIPREEHQELLGNCYRMLKRDSYLLITMGSSDWVGSEEFHGTTMYWSHYGREKNVEMVKAAGFEITYEVVDESGNEKHLVVFAKK